MRVAGRRATSLFDGLGINYVLFCQGCKHNCEGCQNPETWSMDGGVEMTVEEIESDIEKYMPLITGVTFSGGDPVYQLSEVLKLDAWAKAKRLKTTLYTGFSVANDKWLSELPFDYIIDGRFEKSLRSSACAFRGSKNQNVYQRMEAGYVNINEKVDGVIKK